MNSPYGTQRPTYDAAAIEALYAQTQQSIDEYHRHPFARCGHGEGCTRRFRKWGLR